MEQPNQNPYEFIINPSSQQHNNRAINLGNGKNKIFVYAVFGFVVLIVLIIGFSILTSLGKTNNQDLVDVEAQQTELLRVIELGKKDSKSLDVLNSLANLEALVTSDKASVADLLKKRGVETDKTTLSSIKDSEVDASLESAQQQGNYDEVLVQKIQDRSNAYYSKLKNALSDASSKTEKQLLTTAIANLEATAKNAAQNQ